MKKILQILFILLCSCTSNDPVQNQTKLSGKFFTSIQDIDKSLSYHHGYKFISENKAIFFVYYYQPKTVITSTLSFPEKYSLYSKSFVDYTHDNKTLTITNQPNYSNMKCELYDSTLISIPISKLSLLSVDKNSTEWKFITDSIN
ncbi:MAG: hypothetical protein WCK78_17925 [Paludibacter sp.]